MSYFDDLTFVNFRHAPLCAGWKDGVFKDYYVINFAASGNLVWSLNKSPFVAFEGPTIWWTWPGEHFRFGSKNGTTSWDHFFVGFKGERVKRFIEGGLFPGPSKKAYLKPANAYGIQKRFLSLINALCASKNNGICTTLLEGLLNEIFLDPEQKREEAGLEYEIDLLVEEVWKNHYTEYVFQKSAEDLNCSYAHFRRVFKKRSGHSPQAYLLKSRIEYAARRLRNSNDTIKKIAHESRFNDVFYFSKLFKKNRGLAPAQYRTKYSLVV